MKLSDVSEKVILDKWWVHCNALLICIYINKALISQSVTQIFHPWVTQLLLRGKLMFHPWVTFIQSFEGTCKDRFSVMRNLCNQFWCFKPQSTKLDDLVQLNKFYNQKATTQDQDLKQQCLVQTRNGSFNLGSGGI